MPVTRMRMRPWLENMIDSNSISGLMWVDKDKRMFSIPWKHAARHGWEVDKDACLFKRWAVHTGKYIEGQNSPDPKTWKANFRCAMNSLPDIEEVKDKSINKGHQAVRVYRLLTTTTKYKAGCKARDTRRKNKNAKVKTEEVEDCSPVQSPAPQSPHYTQTHEDSSSTQENTVDSTEHQELKYVSASEIEWATSVEIGPDSTNDLYHRRFEVSPEHSPEYDDDTNEIIKLCQQLEQETQWPSSLDDKSFLSNEACIDPYSYSSPGSQGSSDTSSDELDLPMYTDLGVGLSAMPDDFWSIHSSFYQQIQSCSI